MLTLCNNETSALSCAAMVKTQKKVVVVSRYKSFVLATILCFAAE
jgi:hypothetical protein